MAEMNRQQTSLIRYMIENIIMLRRALNAEQPVRRPYINVEELVLRHGEWFQPAPLPPGVRRGTPKRCFSNSYELAARRDDFTYCEGYAFNGIIPTHHAWCVDSAGRVVELTWWPSMTETPPEEWAYFGLTFTPVELNIVAMKREYFGVLHDWQHSYPLLDQPYTAGETVREVYRRIPTP